MLVLLVYVWFQHKFRDGFSAMFQGSFVPVSDWFRIGLSSVSDVSLGTGFASVYLTFIVVYVRFHCMFRIGLDGLFRSGPVPSLEQV